MVPFMDTLYIFGMALLILNLVVNLLHFSPVSPSQPHAWTPTHGQVNPCHSFVSGLIYNKQTSKQTRASKPYNTGARLFSLKKPMSTVRRKGEILCSSIDLFFSALQHYWMSFITEVFSRTLTGSDNASKWLLCMSPCTIFLFIF